MPYLIDGHNLIPRLGLRLDSPDDEMELVAILQDFCRLQRRTAEVYFDGAPAGHARTQKFGAVSAHFVCRGSTADSAIIAALGKLKRAARNWVVVSSDRQVQGAARAAKAEVLSSNEFARLLREARSSASAAGEERRLSQDEVEEWLKLFGRK
jgi:predicted RNA-binding protein with PIN domain